MMMDGLKVKAVSYCSGYRAYIDAHSMHQGIWLLLDSTRHASITVMYNSAKIGQSVILRVDVVNYFVLVVGGEPGNVSD